MDESSAVGCCRLGDQLLQRRLGPDRAEVRITPRVFAPQFRVARRRWSIASVVRPAKVLDAGGVVDQVAVLLIRADDGA
jgi:hypothetical protein